MHGTFELPYHVARDLLHALLGRDDCRRIHWPGTDCDLNGGGNINPCESKTKLTTMLCDQHLADPQGRHPCSSLRELV